MMFFLCKEYLVSEMKELCDPWTLRSIMVSLGFTTWHSVIICLSECPIKDSFDNFRLFLGIYFISQVTIDLSRDGAF